MGTEEYLLVSWTGKSKGFNGLLFSFRVAFQLTSLPKMLQDQQAIDRGDHRSVLRVRAGLDQGLQIGPGTGHQNDEARGRGGGGVVGRLGIEVRQSTVLTSRHGRS